MNKRILLINPDSTRRVYLETNVRAGTPILPTLGLATVAGALKERGAEVRVIDLDLADVQGKNPTLELAAAVKKFRPDTAGITSITPSWNRAREIARDVKKLSPDTYVVMGGVHASLFPAETLEGGAVDAVAIGEADYTLCDILDADGAAGLPGAAILDGDALKINNERRDPPDMDSLPVPAWELFDTSEYRMSRLTERRRPGGYIETSRGCPFNCIYCNKNTFGRRFRAKSPGRVIAEIEEMLNRYGFRELHIVDDGFSTDMDRAKEICEEIVRRGLHFPFNLFNGIRADRVDGELCRLLKRAGCYQVAFGVESGSDRVLESVSKGLTKDVIRRAVRMCRKAGLETFGFFMIALPEDTVKTVRETIDFAVELDMTISKFDISVPLPGTRMFEDYDRAGLIHTRDWSKYIFHRTDAPIFDHPNMSWKTIERLYHEAYRKTYLRPEYIMKRFVHGVRTGGLWYDVVYFFRSRWR